MSERIDHAAEARRLQGGARDIIRAANKAPGTLAPHMAAVIMLDDARLEAQLALVEQQRISNLISLFTASQDAENVGGAIADFANEIWDHMADEPIRAALGLTAEQEGENDE